MKVSCLAHMCECVNLLIICVGSCNEKFVCGSTHEGVCSMIKINSCNIE